MAEPYKLTPGMFSRDRSQEDEGPQFIDPQSQAIAARERYSGERGFIDTALGALDYVGNISRSGILGFERDGFSGAYNYIKQAADKRRYTTPRVVRDVITENLGLGKVRLSEEGDAWYNPGVIGDFALDIVTDIFTDPITFATSVLTFGGSAAAKGLVSGGKAAKNVTRAMKLAQAGKGNVPRAALALNIGKGSLGAVYGVGSAHPDASLGEKIMRGAAGAAMVGAGIKYGPKLIKGLNSFGDQLTDAYAVATRGTEFADKAKAERLVRKGWTHVTEPIAAWMRHGRTESLKGLDAAQRVKVSEVMHKVNNKFIGKRNDAVRAFLKGGKMTKHQERLLNTPLQSIVDTEFKKFAKKHPGVDNEFLRARFLNKGVYQTKKFREAKRMQDEFRRIDTNITEDLTRNYVPGLLAKEGDDVAAAVGAWANHNSKVIAKLNDATGRNIVGLKWHIPDIWKPKDFEEGRKMINHYHLGRAKSTKRDFTAKSMAADIENNFWADVASRPKRVRRLQKEGVYPTINAAARDAATAGEQATVSNFFKNNAYDSVYGSYTEKFAKNWLNKQTRDAMALVAKYHSTPAKGGFQKFENGLKLFDKMTNLMKKNMLFFSTTWLKTNYFDNAAKSFVEGGTQGLMDAVSFGAMKRGMMTDVKNILMNKHVPHKRADLEEMLQQGVLDNLMFQSLVDDDVVKWLSTPQQIQKAMDEKGIMATIGSKLPFIPGEKVGERFDRVLNAWTNGLEKTTGLAGSFMESTARASHYVRTKKALTDSGIKEATAKGLAAKSTKKTFFDYADISHMERAVFKRIFPFYSFYSKNLPYWTKAMVDPTRAGRIIGLDKLRRSAGREPTERERKGYGDYILEGAPRALDKSRRGEFRAVSFPHFSLVDAVKTMGAAETLMRAIPGALGISKQEVTKPLLETFKDIFIDKSNPYMKLPFEFLLGKDLFTGGPMLPSQAMKQQKYIFSRGFKWYAMQEGLQKLGIGRQTAISNMAGSLGIRVDKKGNPISESDLNVVVDKILGTVFPTGAIDQIFGSVGKVYFGKDTVTEAILDKVMPFKIFKMSPNYHRMQSGKVRKEEKAAKKMERAREAQERRAKRQSL